MHTRARQVSTAPCVPREPALHDVLSTFYGAVDSSVYRTRLLCKSVTPAADEKKNTAHRVVQMAIFLAKLKTACRYLATSPWDITSVRLIPPTYVAIPMLMPPFRAPTPVQDWYHYNAVITVCAMTNSAGWPCVVWSLRVKMQALSHNTTYQGPKLLVL